MYGRCERRVVESNRSIRLEGCVYSKAEQVCRAAPGLIDKAKW
jgi:hypothetical protein